MPAHIIINFSIEIMALIMVLVLLWCAVTHKTKGALKNAFIIWDANLCCLLLSQIGIWSTNSEVISQGASMNWYLLNQIFFILDFVFYNTLYLSFYEYVIALLREIQVCDQKKYKNGRYFLIGWIVVVTVIFTMSLWTGTLYSITDGFAEYTSTYERFMYLLVIGPLLDQVIILKKRKALGLKKTVLLSVYLVIPTGVLLWIDLGLNLSISYAMYAFVAMAIYIEINLEQGKMLALREAEIARHEMEMTNMRVDLMMSQIRPHFLYNALSSIAFLCAENPKEAELATNEFASYLKINLRSIDSQKPIPFAMELNHVENYLKIQKRRFIDRINIQYDIAAEDFLIPALALQTIVENSVKHAVEARFEPTTIMISSQESADAFIVTVEDDGPGFDTSQPPKTDRLHIGVDSTSKRLADMVDGKLTISSTIGKGTKNIITIPKDKGGISE